MSQTPWTSHRSRAVALCGRYPFAAELLTLYLALLDVWETWCARGAVTAGATRPARARAAGRPRAGAARCTPNGARVRSSAGPTATPTPTPTPPSRTCGSTAAPAVDGT